MKNEKLYLVRLGEHGGFSMFGYLMWTLKEEVAERYTREQAEKLIAEIPHHMGKGTMVEVTQ